MSAGKKYTAGLALAGALGSGFFLDAPYAWAGVFFCLGVCFGALMALARRGVMKDLCLSLVTIMIALCAGEVYLGIDQAFKQARAAAEAVAAARRAPQETEPGFLSGSDYFFSNDPAVGYGPKPVEGRMHGRNWCGEDLVYDVVYSTLPSGWRVTPQHPEADTAVVIFGCSFTWGEGLNDKDSFPWKLGELLGERYQVFNFGLQGYGSHHMLAWIEQGIVKDIAARYPKVHAFYSSIRGHELRSMGYSQWDPFGPWYGFADGRIVRKGVFADDLSPLRPLGDAVFGKSALYQKFVNTRFVPRYFRFKRHAGIIKEADRQLRECCRTRLTALLWPRAAFKDAVEKEGVPVLDLTPYFPDWEDSSEKYKLHRCDGHPNARATDIVAKALADYIRAHP